MEPASLTEWLHPYLVPFYTLSYPVETPKNPDSFPDSSYYRTGPLDLCIMISCIAVMAILRDVFRLSLFEPFAQWKFTRDIRLKRSERNAASKEANGYANGNGHANEKANGLTNGNGHSHAGTAIDCPLTPKQERKMKRSIMRFAEQGWPAIYYPLQWAFGFYVYRQLPTKLLDPIDVWTAYPHIPIPGTMKFYYLSQTAFYTHQILILNAEARRKDHFQMMAHHVITVVLMLLSYYTNFTRVGSLIMVLMDWCDIFLPLAKMVKYLEVSQVATDTLFVIWVVSWFVTRHCLYLIVIISSVWDAPSVIERLWDPARDHYYNKTAYVSFSTMLISLQIIQLMWFALICRIAWRAFMTGQGASDDRSDDESEKDD